MLAIRADFDKQGSISAPFHLFEIYEFHASCRPARKVFWVNAENAKADAVATTDEWHKLRGQYF
jgi:hypothetical protein